MTRVGRSHHVLSVAVAVTTLSLLGPVSGLRGVAASEADPATETRVDDLSASASGSSISVTGQATFVDMPRVVGSDVAGDADIQFAGMDLVEAILGRPTHSSDVLRFVLRIADPLPEDMVTPLSVYLWWFKVETFGGSRSRCYLSAAANPQPGTPSDNVLGCQEGGNWSTIPGVEGSMKNGALVWDVPMTSMPGGGVSRVLRDGSLPPYDGASSSLKGPGSSTRVESLAVDSEYEVPSAAVRVGLAPAGTDPSSVALTRFASPGADGSFSTFLDASGLAPGEYVVVAEACYGEGNCDSASSTVTI